MRALLTGSGGFVGRHLIEYLKHTTDWELVGLRRGPNPAGALRTVQADLLDAAAVREAVAAVRPEIVVHLASQSSVADSFKDPAGTIQNNVLGQLNLLEAIRAAQIDPLVLIVSSNEVYGRPARLPVDETAALLPPSPYAVSKVGQEMLAIQYAESYGMRLIRMRPFNHIGPGQEPRFVLPSFARQIALIEAGQQEPVLRVGNLSARRDFSDVRDIVRSYHLALLHGEPGAAYNVGSGRSLAISDLLDHLLSLSSAAITVETDPERFRPVDIPEVICDAGLFRSRTGWQPEFPIEQTLAAVLDEWRTRTASP